MRRLLLLVFSLEAQIFVFSSIVNDINIELDNACSLYQISRYDFLNPMMIGYKEMENSIFSRFGKLIYIFLKLVIKNLQFHNSSLFDRVTHLNQRLSVQ